MEWLKGPQFKATVGVVIGTSLFVFLAMDNTVIVPVYVAQPGRSLPSYMSYNSSKSSNNLFAGRTLLDKFSQTKITVNDSVVLNRNESMMTSSVQVEVRATS